MMHIYHERMVAGGRSEMTKGRVVSYDARCDQPNVCGSSFFLGQTQATDGTYDVHIVKLLIYCSYGWTMQEIHLLEETIKREGNQMK